MKLLRHIYGFLKLEHTLFSLPLLFAGAALGMARQGQGLSGLGWRRTAGIALAGAGARTFALSLNRIMDRNIDARNPRTKSRELPSKRLSLSQAWAIAMAGFFIYMGTAFLLGFWPLVLSPIPLVVFAVYPLMKRFTVLSHLGVGFGLALSPLGGYVGAVNRFPLEPGIWLLAAFTLCWVAGFDVLYAIQDEKHDRQQGLHSVAGKFGRSAAVRAGLALHVLAFVCLVGVGFAIISPRLLAWFSLLPAAWLLFMEQRLGGSFSLEANARFFKVNAWMGFAVFFIVLVGLYF